MPNVPAVEAPWRDRRVLCLQGKNEGVAGGKRGQSDGCVLTRFQEIAPRVQLFPIGERPG